MAEDNPGAALNPQEQVFADTWLETRCKAVAYRTAYGPKRQTATERMRATVVFQQPHVQRYLDWRLTEIADTSRITLARVIDEIASIAFFDVTQVLGLKRGRGGRSYVLSVEDFENLTPAQRAAVRSVRIIPTKFGDRIEVDFYDKLKAQELLGKYLGVFGGDLPNIMVPVQVNIDLSASAKGNGKGNGNGNGGKGNGGGNGDNGSRRAR